MNRGVHVLCPLRPRLYNSCRPPERTASGTAGVDAAGQHCGRRVKTSATGPVPPICDPHPAPPSALPNGQDEHPPPGHDVPSGFLVNQPMRSRCSMEASTVVRARPVFSAIREQSTAPEAMASRTMASGPCEADDADARPEKSPRVGTRRGKSRSRRNSIAITAFTNQCRGNVLEEKT